MRRVAILFLLVGCDRVFGLPDLKLPDASQDSGRRCARGTPFAAPSKVPIAGTNSVESVRFNAQQTLALIALSNGDSATTDIYQATVTDQVIGGYSKMTGVSSPYYDSYPTFADKDHIVFASRRTSPTALVEIWLATTSNGGFDMATITALELGATGEPYANEPYTPNPSAMYFSGATGDDSNLYRAAGSVQALAEITRLDELSTVGARESAPVVATDELEIFFASDRGHGAGASLSGLDIYTAVRETTDANFGAPLLLPLLSVPDEIDYPVWMSPDGCQLYVISKTGNVGTLYVATR